MKAIVMGNAGAGKTTLARALIDATSAAWLSLDFVAFREGSTRRPLAESIGEARRFIEEQGEWVIEGCYADIIEPLLEHCELLVFLNPGVERCLAHCRSRAWEQDKFDTPEAQEEQLEALVEWAAAYETRDDEYGLRAHRRLFEGFTGKKLELVAPEPDAAGRVLSLLAERPR